MKIANVVFLTLAFFGFHAMAAVSDDGQIARIMEVANSGEVDAAETAKSRAKNPEVLKFAKAMADGHAKNRGELKDLARKQKIKLTDSDDSKQLAKDAKNKVTLVKSAKDVDFDRTYIQSQVEMHEALLQKLDHELIDGTKDTELKSYLERTRADVASHLDEAKAIQQKL